MVLASTLMRGIHPPDNIQNGGRPRPRRQHFDDESLRIMAWQWLLTLCEASSTANVFVRLSNAAFEQPKRVENIQSSGTVGVTIKAADDVQV